MKTKRPSQLFSSIVPWSHWRDGAFLLVTVTALCASVRANTGDQSPTGPVSFRVGVGQHTAKTGDAQRQPSVERFRWQDPQKDAGQTASSPSAVPNGPGLVIIPTFDTSITGNPNSAAIQAMINQACAAYHALFTDPVTIRIFFRYTTTEPDGTPLPGGILARSNFVIYTVPWNNFITALQADATTGNDAIANATLPAPLSTSLVPSSAGGRAVGLNTPGVMAADGTVGSGTFDGIVTLNSAQDYQFTRPHTLNNYDALRSTEHEMDEVIGLGSFLNGDAVNLRPQDLFTWSSAGVRNVTGNGARYFSINSGNTDIVDLNQDANGDFGDWLSPACPQANPYVQNAFSCPGADQVSDVTATSPEGINLDVVGYNLNTGGGPTPTPVPTPTPGCTPFSQAFDDVNTLIPAGWFVQNNSQPGPGTTSWFQGNNMVFPSQSGAATAYVAANFNSGTGTSTLSNWLMMPPMTLQNGVALTFYTRTIDAPQFPDRLQVRMSVNGASTNVGTNATDVGDFTALLLDINPSYTLTDYPAVWTQFTATVTGLGSATTGRLAFRYFVESGGPDGKNSNYIGIDTVQITGGCGGGSSSLLGNISTRMRVQTGNNVLIGGFIVTGGAPKTVAIRGIGPSLGAFGIPDLLADPTLELRSSNGTVLDQNDNWQDNSVSAGQLTALGLALQNANESGLVDTLQPNSYTAVLSGKNQTSGVGLLEIYDANTGANAQLANISTRGFVETGTNVMIGGFIVIGTNTTRVVVRGMGPSLAAFGLNPVLSDPVLEVHDVNGTTIISNDEWQSDPNQAAVLTSLGLAPTFAHEAALVATLSAGSYTAVVSGSNGATGIGLVEVYNVH